MDFTEELQQLQKMLHFPEEVALHLTENEHALFQKVHPVEFIRQVCLDKFKPSAMCQPGIQNLVHRFQQVHRLYHALKIFKAFQVALYLRSKSNSSFLMKRD